MCLCPRYLESSGSEVYRSKGKPKLSVLSQCLHLMCVIPTVLWAINYGFDFLCEMRSLVRLTGIVINLIILYFLTHISPIAIIRNIFPAIFAAGIMYIIHMIINPSETIIFQILTILLCCAVYTICILSFKNERNCNHLFGLAGLPHAGVGGGFIALCQSL